MTDGKMVESIRKSVKHDRPRATAAPTFVEFRKIIRDAIVKGINRHLIRTRK